MSWRWTTSSTSLFHEYTYCELLSQTGMKTVTIQNNHKMLGASFRWPSLKENSPVIRITASVSTSEKQKKRHIHTLTRLRRCWVLNVYNLYKNGNRGHDIQECGSGSHRLLCRQWSCESLEWWRITILTEHALTNSKSEESTQDCCETNHSDNKLAL